MVIQVHIHVQCAVYMYMVGPLVHNFSSCMCLPTQYQSYNNHIKGLLQGDMNALFNVHVHTCICVYMYMYMYLGLTKNDYKLIQKVQLHKLILALMMAR